MLLWPQHMEWTTRCRSPETWCVGVCVCLTLRNYSQSQLLYIICNATTWIKLLLTGYVDLPVNIHGVSPDRAAVFLLVE